MRMKDFQKMIYEIYYTRDSARGIDKTMLWLVEEVGELAEAVRKDDKIGEEIADVIAWVTSIANLYDVDIEEELMKKYPGNCIRCGEKPCRCDE
ncbi:MAG TPA: nucleotide pyrophosphohydrolase [Archaeoglobaceae archaeon]|nr:nucleotide pyrophosphohydrolase [Archaeoglobaceae archaeon]